jgi:hemerythrin-like domain-containing protein
MPTILDRLSDDHRNMARLYDLIGRELKVFKTGEHPDYELVKKIVDYCLEYPDKMHHPLEDLAMKSLKARHSNAARIVGDLGQEHRSLGVFAHRFSAALGNVLEDELLPRDWFLEVANDFLSFSRRHMQMEEVLFFPALRKHLTPEDWNAVEAAAGREIGWTPGGAAPALEAAYRDIMAWGETSGEPGKAAGA